MSYDDNLQNINEHFAGQKDWWSKKQCNTCKKNPDWYYCGEYLGALDVHTGEHYEDIFEKINNIVSELPTTAIINLDSEPFLTVASGSTTNITLEDEDGNAVAPIGSDGSTIIVPTNFEMEIYFANQFQQSITLNSRENNIVNIKL